MPRSLRVFFPLFILILFLASCAVTPNYLALTGPRYVGAYASAETRDDDVFKVITWNIKYARGVKQATRFLQESPGLQNPDAVLLQEMDERGTEAVARALGWNYVYYPASIHPRHGRDFGLAILSPWPLTGDGKLLLPHYSPRNGQTRIAIRTWVQTPTRSVLVYNTHLETSIMPPAQRLDQLETILADVEPDASAVVIGGDFNTVTPWEQATLLDTMAQAGFAWMSAEAGVTVSVFNTGVIMDYLFARGMVPLASGVVSDVDVSDHLPLWAEMR